MDQQTRESDRELWNPAIHWLLNIAPGELGAKGTLGSTISALEHGGETSGVPNTDPYSNYQMGWCVGDSPAEKWRKLAPVWFTLGRDTQGVLLAHYMVRNDLPDTQRVAVDGALGKFANAGLWVHEGEQLAKLLEACVDRGRQGRSRIIAAAVKRTEEAVRVAHRVWMAVTEVGPAPLVDARTIIPEPSEAEAKRWASEYERRQHERDVRAPEFAAALVVDRWCMALGRVVARARKKAAKRAAAKESRDAA